MMCFDERNKLLTKLLRYLILKGTIDKKMLFDVPFTEINHEGITGVFQIEQATKVISILDKINENVTKVK